MTRSPRDARWLPPLEKMALRHKVVHAVRRGMNQMAAARRFGVSRVAVNGWVQRWRKGGLQALRPRPLGPRGPQPARKDMAMVAQLTVARHPDQLGLKGALWTRAAVRELMLRRCGVGYPMVTVAQRVRKWGLGPPNPFRTARARGPLAVRRWLEEEYPAIRARAKLERAEIHWAGVMDLLPYKGAGGSRRRHRPKPVVPEIGPGRRQVISTVTSSGTQALMVVRGDVSAPVFIRFLERLLRHRRGRRLFLILGDHPAYQAPVVRRWIAANAGRRLTPFYLPEVPAQPARTPACPPPLPSVQARLSG